MEFNIKPQPAGKNKKMNKPRPPLIKTNELTPEAIRNLLSKFERDVGQKKIRSIVFAIEFSDEKVRAYSYGDVNAEKTVEALQIVYNQALEDKLAREYTNFGDDKKFHGLNLLKKKDELKDLFGIYKVETVLDYGCGRALSWKTLQEELHIEEENLYLYDPYIEQYSTLTDKKVDCVLFFDVAEHLPEHQIDEVFTRMFKRASKIFVMTFCNRPAKKTFSDGSNVHITLRPRVFWEEKVKKHNTRNLPFFIFETV